VHAVVIYRSEKATIKKPVSRVALASDY
jgi:hypothetical protein